MTPFLSWFRERPAWGRRVWCILGKGPTLSLLGSLRDQLPATAGFLGLNQACLVEPVELTCVTDLEVLERSGPLLLERGGTLILPYYPHQNFKPHVDRPLPALLTEPGPVGETLRALEAQGRLTYYRSSWSGGFQGHPECGPCVTVRAFSAVSALHLLCLAGVRYVRSLGVDGGKRYAKAFAHLRPLENGRKDFNAQFAPMQKILDRFPLAEYCPLRTGVFVVKKPVRLRGKIALNASERLPARHPTTSGQSGSQAYPLATTPVTGPPTRVTPIPEAP